MSEDELDNLDDEDDTAQETIRETVHNAVRTAFSQQKNPIWEAAVSLFVIWVFVSGFDYFSYARWMNTFRYSAWYDVDSNKVTQVQDKPPTDCDFLRSPIGFKGCRYDKTVTVERVITGRDTATNRPIVSYDDGKTWAWNDDSNPVPASKTVYVSWEKKEE